MLFLGLGAPVINAADQGEQLHVAQPLGPAPGGDEKGQRADPPAQILCNISGVAGEAIGAMGYDDAVCRVRKADEERHSCEGNDRKCSSTSRQEMECQYLVHFKVEVD